MKLVKCYISSFGTLKDFSFDFKDGLNVINHKNGWGKTTFATFIKSMFYGLNDSKRSIEDNERKKHTPWNSTTKFGGYIIFNRDGKDYKIERYFGARSSEDTVVLVDLTTGKTYNSQEDLGKRLFGIDEDGFLSSTYLSQKDFEIKSSASLTAKFNETCEIQDVDLFNFALEKLDVESKKLLGRADKGEIPDTKRKIIRLQEEISLSKGSREEILSLSDKLKNIDAEIVIVKEKISALSTKISRYKSAVEYKVLLEKRTELYNKLQDVKNKISDIELFFNNDVANAKALEDYVAIYEEYSITLSTIKTLSDDLDDTVKSTNSIEKKSFLKDYVNFLPFAIILISLLGFLGGVIVGLITTVIAVLFAASFYLVKKSKHSENYNKINEIVDLKRKKIDGFSEIAVKYENALKEYFAKIKVSNCDYKENIEEIKNNYQTYLNLQNEKNNLETELSKTSLIENYDKAVISLNPDEVTKEIKELNEKLSLLERERSSALTMSMRLQENADKLLDLESELFLLEDKLSLLKDRYEVLISTIKFLKEADEKLKIKYREPLEKSLNKYLSLIDDSYMATIDIDFNMAILKNGVTLSVEYFSEGLKNSFNICKRFAIIDVIFNKEKPFIILDDPLTNFDKERISAILEVFKKMQNEYQIIYFVCHDSRAINE